MYKLLILALALVGFAAAKPKPNFGVPSFGYSAPYGYPAYSAPLAYSYSPYNTAPVAYSPYSAYSSYPAYTAPVASVAEVASVAPIYSGYSAPYNYGAYGYDSYLWKRK